MPKTAKTEDQISERIVKLKDVDGKTWAEISEAVGKPMGKCMFLYEVASVTPKTRITAKTEEELDAKIAKAREDGLSWGVIAARSGKSEGYCKAAFSRISGESAKGHRIGKGGRFPDGEGGTPKEPGAKKASGAVKKASKAKPVKKVAKKALAAKKTAGAVKSAAVKKAAKKTAKKVAA